MKSYVLGSLCLQALKSSELDRTDTSILRLVDTFSFLATAFALRWQTKGITVAGYGGPVGTTADRFSTPYSITVDSSNAIYVADYYNDRVQKFSPDSSIGTTVAGQANGAVGSTAYDLHYPTCVLLDSNGNLYVSDSANHRVQFFANGSLLGITVAGNGKKKGAANE